MNESMRPVELKVPYKNYCPVRVECQYEMSERTSQNLLITSINLPQAQLFRLYKRSIIKIITCIIKVS